MDIKSVFNAVVCLLGIILLLIHSVSIIISKDKRIDEKRLLQFFIFTIIHFATYFTFTIIKINYTSDSFIIGFYTTFYIMNNIELFLLFRYMERYIDSKTKVIEVLKIINVVLFGVFVLLDIINIFNNMFFTSTNGLYERSELMILSQGYQFVMLTLILLYTSLNKSLNIQEKIAFAIYCILPFVAIILQNIFQGYAIAYLSIVVAIEVLFVFLSVKKNLLLLEEKEKNKDAQMRIMLSQIQPHFMYNALSSISTLITIDPKKAQTALDNFTLFLRNNLSSLTSSNLIPFEDELNHIKTYISLENMRFGDRIKDVYDIKDSDFLIPPLTIQPIVENAIKHGITKRLEGGTVSIKAYKTESEYIVEVVDDGVGFEIKEIDNSNHFGINNIKYRIEKTIGGKVNIKSEVGKGTMVQIIFNRQE